MEITQENIERGERMQQAELKKCEMVIEKAEQELKKGFISSIINKARERVKNGKNSGAEEEEE